jgi:hypothetical protein
VRVSPNQLPDRQTGVMEQRAEAEDVRGRPEHPTGLVGTSVQEEAVLAGVGPTALQPRQ